MKSEKIIITIHGLFGSFEDWSKVVDFFKTEISSNQNEQSHAKYSHEKIKFIHFDLFQIDLSNLNKQQDEVSVDVFQVDTVLNFNEICKFIVEKINRVKVENFKKNISTHFYFVGYSLGGRIGLHLLTSEVSQLFEKFIFLSVNPGLISNEEKRNREANDLKWLNELTYNTWDNFKIKWSSQDVFKNDQVDIFKNKNYDLKKLESGFKELSLSQQLDMRSMIMNHKTKIKWLVGDQDVKFKELAVELHQNLFLENINIIQNVGHRIYQNPEVIKIIFNEVYDLACNT